jgi:hypothetical protein
MESYPRTGSRCKKTYRYNKRTGMCQTKSPVMSPKGTSYRRTGKRCRPSYRYNKSKKLCVSKFNSPSPVSDASYEPTGRRCKKSFRYHKPSGLCVYNNRPKVQRSRVTPKVEDIYVTPPETPEESVVEDFYSPDDIIEVNPVVAKPNILAQKRNVGVEL